MRIKINLKTLSDITFGLIIGQVIIFRFFNVQGYVNKLLLLLEIICIFLNRTNKFGLNKWLIVFGGILFLNGFYYGYGDVFWSNILMLFYPLLDIFFVGWYSKKYQFSMIRMLKKIVIPVNVYMWINIIVMLIQMRGTYFMVGYSDWENPAYWDLISGLFGYSTTHVVCMFTTGVILYDLVEIKLLKGNSKLYMKFNIILLIIVSSWMAIINDNIAFFIVAPLSIMCWIFFSTNLKRVSKFLKICLACLTIVLLTSVTFTIAPDIRTFLYKEILYKFIGVFQVAQSGNNITHGSMERIAQIIYGLNVLNGWKLGAGFNKVGLFHNGYFGFAHFGNANAGGMVCLGGIWSWLALCLVYSENISSFLKVNKKSVIVFCFSIVFVILLSIYTTLFTDVSIALSAYFIVVVFWYANRLNIIDKKG